MLRLACALNILFAFRQAQRSYVLLMMGQQDMAQKLCMAVMKTKPSDGMVGAVVANNLAVLRKDHELFDSHKRLRSATTEGVEAKLLPRQLEHIRFNRCLLLLYMNKNSECQESAQELAAQYPGSVRPRLIQVLHTRVRCQEPSPCPSRLPSLSHL